MEIKATNVNQLFSDMLWRFKTSGVPDGSRNGPVLRIPEPVLTTLFHPEERVLFHEGRDANPIFHLMESVWMLAGRRDVEFLSKFNSRIAQYSDDGRTFNAAYGFRMRQGFRRDQLVEVIELLRREPKSRQAVVQLWDAEDLTRTTLDKACNTSMIFSRSPEGMLDLLVTNRSNDAWFGYAGANAVHFTVIQEFVAAALGWPLGTYSTVTANLHLYTELYDAARYVNSPPPAEDFDFYRTLKLTALPLMANTDYESFLVDCEQFCSDPFSLSARYRHGFFPAVARPMALVSHVRKLRSADGLYWANRIEARDWRAAMFGWIERRERARNNA